MCLAEYAEFPLIKDMHEFAQNCISQQPNHLTLPQIEEFSVYLDSIFLFSQKNTLGVINFKIYFTSFLKCLSLFLLMPHVQ